MAENPKETTVGGDVGASPTVNLGGGALEEALAAAPAAPAVPYSERAEIREIMNREAEREAGLQSAGVQAAVPEYHEKAVERERRRQSDLAADARMQTRANLEVFEDIINNVQTMPQDGGGDREEDVQTMPQDGGADREEECEDDPADSKNNTDAALSGTEELDAVETEIIAGARGATGEAKAGSGKAVLAGLYNAAAAAPKAASGTAVLADLYSAAAAGNTNTNTDDVVMMDNKIQATVNNTVNIQSEPGAYAHAPTDYVERLEPAPEPEESELDGSNNSNENAEDANSGLVEAHAVHDEEEGAPITIGTSEAEMMKIRREKEDEFRTWATRLSALICVVLVVIVVVLVFAVPRNADEVIMVATAEPTSAPTAAAMPAPTPYAVTLPPFTMEALEDAESSQSKAYRWLQDDPHMEDHSEMKRLQRMALVTFYYATGGAYWTLKDSWLSYEVDECEWFSKHNASAGSPDFFLTGSTVSQTGNESICNEQGFYLQLVLPSNKLVGTLPKEIALLHDLHRLEIMSNAFSGTLPSELGLMSKLKVFSCGSTYSSPLLSLGLAGTLPTEMGEMTSLQELEIQATSIAGSIPTEIANLKNLTYLAVRGNEISGTIPSEVGLVTNLKHLQLNTNQMTGTLPSELGLLTKMTFLGVHLNQLTGTIPMELEALLNLEIFWVEQNFFTGTIPNYFAQMPALFVLSVRDLLLTGTVPPKLWENPNLFSLDISQNPGLAGTLPTEIGYATGLINFFGNENDSWSGTIPSEIGLLTGLEYLWISECNLSGTFPSEIAGLPNLNTLLIDGNRLTGTIPSAVANSQQLVWLQMNETLLTGELPESLCGVDDLVFDCPQLCGCDCQCADSSN